MYTSASCSLCFVFHPRALLKARLDKACQWRRIAPTYNTNQSTISIILEYVVSQCKKIHSSRCRFFFLRAGIKLSNVFCAWRFLQNCNSRHTMSFSWPIFILWSFMHTVRTLGGPTAPWTCTQPLLISTFHSPRWFHNSLSREELFRCIMWKGAQSYCSNKPADNHPITPGYCSLSPFENDNTLLAFGHVIYHFKE